MLFRSSKGETVEDTARVVSNYADVIAMRHPKEGAPLRASLSARVPVILSLIHISCRCREPAAKMHPHHRYTVQTVRPASGTIPAEHRSSGVPDDSSHPAPDSWIPGSCAGGPARAFRPGAGIRKKQDLMTLLL